MDVFFLFIAFAFATIRILNPLSNPMPAVAAQVMLDDIKFVQLEPCNAGVGTSCRQTFRVETETCGIQNLFVAFFCSGDSDVEVKAEPPLLRPSIHFTLEAVDTTRPCGMPTPDDDIATGGDGDAL